MLHDGKLNFYWVQVNNNVQAAPNNSNETYPGYRNPDNFVVVSDVYPTVTAMSADVVLPAAMWVEKEGGYGNAERRTHFWHQLVKAPGDARSDLWQMMEFSKRFTTDEVWSQDILDANPNYRGKTLFEVLFRNGNVDRFPLSQTSPDYENFESKTFGFYVQKGLFEEYASFGRGHGHDLAPFDRYHEVRGLRWPVVDGKETRWRYREGYDPYVKPGKGVEFYGNADGKAKIIAVPYEPPAESPRQGVRHLARDRARAGTLAFRLHDHAGAGALQVISRCALLHACGGRPRTRHQSGRRDQAGVAARRNPNPRRHPRPQSHAARRRVRAVVRRQPTHQQGHTRRDGSDFETDGFQEMRGQDHSGVTAVVRTLFGALLSGALVLAAGAIYAQGSVEIVPRLTGANPPMSDVPAPPLARPITDDKRLMRNYPEQPPIIPHSIDNYQLTLKTNRCLDCHRRQFTEGSGAPMISVTHFMDRDGQVLADVTPRRYFCTECHVQQTDAVPLVPNDFQDMLRVRETK